MARRRVGGRLVLVAAMVLGACAESGDSGPDAVGLGVVASPRAPVQEMLRKRADRLLQGDVEGYLAPMSPEARAFEEPIARNAATLPLSGIDLTIDEATVSLDGERFQGAQVTFTYRYKDLPHDNPFHMYLLYDLRREGEEWIVEKAGFGGDLPPIWAIRPVEMATSAHFLALYRPGTKGVTELLARAETALGDLLPKLTLEADDRYLVVLADPDDFEEVAGVSSAAAAAAAVKYRGSALHPNLTRPENRFMAANLPVLAQSASVPMDGTDQAFSPEIVFRHELAHLALSRFTRECTELWVVEAAAMFLSGERRVDAWRRLLADPGEFERRRFLDMSGPEPEEGDEDERPVVDYAYANAAALYLVETHGAEVFFDFYQNFKELDPRPCKGRFGRTERSTGADRMLRRYYRFDLATLDSHTHAYIRKGAAGG